MQILQIAVHAIGDRANDELAALYRSLLPTGLGTTHDDSSNSSLNQRPVSRHRVEHAQHLSSPASLEALREAGVVAVTNPLHLISDLDIIEARLGKGRAQSGVAFPSKALLEVCSSAVLHCMCVMSNVLLQACSTFVVCVKCTELPDLATAGHVSLCKRYQQTISLLHIKESLAVGHFITF